MPEYMLDTDISSYIMKRSHDAVLRRLQKIPIGVVCISVITKSELLFGVEVSPRRKQDHAALDEYLRHVEVLDFPDEAALHYAQIRAALKASGTMIGANDLFIAAHARSLELTLVTNNTGEFGRVRDLKFENWPSRPVADLAPEYNKATTPSRFVPAATQNGLCGDVPQPFDLTILSSIQEYEFRTIDHSSSAISGTFAI